MHYSACSNARIGAKNLHIGLANVHKMNGPEDTVTDGEQSNSDKDGNAKSPQIKREIDIALMSKVEQIDAEIGLYRSIWCMVSRNYARYTYYNWAAGEKRAIGMK
jgi:hypothetical protein